VKSVCTLLLLLTLFVCISAAQNAPGQPAQRTDVYHVHFAKAALGKGAEEGDFLKRQDPKAPMAGHYIVIATRAARTGLCRDRASRKQCNAENRWQPATGKCARPKRMAC